MNKRQERGKPGGLGQDLGLEWWAAWPGAWRTQSEAFQSHQVSKQSVDLGPRGHSRSCLSSVASWLWTPRVPESLGAYGPCPGTDTPSCVP